MSEAQPETELKPTIDVSVLEGSISKLWERARLVSDLVMRLKEENRSLRSKSEQLEGEADGLRAAEERLRREYEQTRESLNSQLDACRGELQRLKQDLLHAQTNGSEIFSKEEKEALKARMKELIARINSRL